MMSNGVKERIKYTLSMCHSDRSRSKQYEGRARRGVGRHERIKRGSGIKGFVYYESIKRVLNKRLIFECRCDVCRSLFPAE